MTPNWARHAAIYHLYPLGCLGAPLRNLFNGRTTDRLGDLHGWLDYLEDLGVDTLLLGPLFQSSAHGYDVADYFHVDHRLGSDEALTKFSRALHDRGIRVVLDAVFHHTGRDFWASRMSANTAESRRNGIGTTSISLASVRLAIRSTTTVGPVTTTWRN